MASWQFSASRQPPRNTTNDSWVADVCLRVFDACLLGILFLAPLFFGGRHPLGRSVFIAFAGIAGVAWFLRQSLVGSRRWPRTWANLLALAALLLVAFQLIPLPTAWLEQLAPRNLGLLNLWTAEKDSFGSWNTLSLTPSATKLALATLIAYVLLFVSTVGRLQETTDIERLVRWIALAALGMCGFGLLQYLTSNGLFFWFYEYPYSNTFRVAKGSFTCRNHFAHFLTLGTGPLLAWIVLQRHSTKRKSSKRKPTGAHTQGASSSAFAAAIKPFVLHVGLGAVILAVLLSLSRGGTLALAVTSVSAITFYYLRGLLSSSYMYGLAMLGLLVIGMLSLSGYEQVANRIDDFTTGSFQDLDSHEGRRKIWTANLGAIREGALFGSGAGSHREIHPVYLPSALNREYTHAENGYLQVATETGLLGMGLLLLALLMVCQWCWKAVRHAHSTQARILAVGISAALAASLVHSAFDFVWFIPSCMSLTLLLAACVLRLAQLSEATQDTEEPSVTWDRSRWIGLAAAVCAAAIWAIHIAIPPAAASLHWDRYLLSTLGNKRQLHLQISDHRMSKDESALQESRVEAMVFHLRNTIAHDPRSSRAHLRLAGKYIQQFDQKQQLSENAMSVEQIREAAFASQFVSAKELRQWLIRAFGQNVRLLYQAHYHAKKALTLCPLQGEGYQHLAKLSFLEGNDTGKIDAYLQQSLVVRPYDRGVIFEAGRQRLLLGQVEPAFKHWQNIYNDPGNHQLKIIRLLVGNLPAPAFLELFSPTWQSLRPVWKHYRSRGSTEDWADMLRYAKARAQFECNEQSSPQSAAIWRSLSRMQSALEQDEAALASLTKAHRAAPHAFEIRRELGEKLLQAKHFRQAEPHFRWCLARHPNDTKLRDSLVEATKSRLSNDRISSLRSRQK